MALISGDSKLLGLLGHGATFTLSPAMHNFAAKTLHQDQVYVNFNLEAAHVPAFLDVFWHLGGQGLNVTMPHKNLVASLVDSSGLRSVNTLTRGQDGWIGHSTDGEGFLRGLARAGRDIHDFDAVVVLGSGGSAQAVLRSIAEATVDKPLMTIVQRRSKGNDLALCEAVSISPLQLVTICSMSPETFTDILKETAGLRRLVIQATSAPKHGDTLEEYAAALDFMTGNDLLVDLIYDHPSQLYFSAISRGLNCLDGLPMLIEQARLSQSLWWGQCASYESMLQAIKQSGWRG